MNVIKNYSPACSANLYTDCASFTTRVTKSELCEQYCSYTAQECTNRNKMSLDIVHVYKQDCYDVCALQSNNETRRVKK